MDGFARRRGGAEKVKGSFTRRHEDHEEFMSAAGLAMGCRIDDARGFAAERGIFVFSCEIFSAPPRLRVIV